VTEYSRRAHVSRQAIILGLGVVIRRRPSRIRDPGHVISIDQSNRPQELKAPGVLAGSSQWLKLCSFKWPPSLTKHLIQFRRFQLEKNMQTHLPTLALIVILWLTLIALVFFLLALQDALKKCAPSSRTMAPGEVWLWIIPVFGLVWQFIAVRNVA